MTTEQYVGSFVEEVVVAELRYTCFKTLRNAINHIRITSLG
jgi:hypothetical protein